MFRINSVGGRRIVLHEFSGTLGTLISYTQHTSPEPPRLGILLNESEREGFKFLHRLVDDWQSGANLFDAAGEVFLICQENSQTIAVGGINIDPYADDPNVGRIRHVYVASEFRRRGIGRTLVERLIDEARDYFRELRLRTNTAIGDDFYRSLGFTPFTDDETASYFLPL